MKKKGRLKTHVMRLFMNQLPHCQFG